MTDNRKNDGRIGTMYVRAFDTYTKFISENKAEIALVGLTLLAVKQSSLRQDVNNLVEAGHLALQTTKSLIEASEMQGRALFDHQLDIEELYARVDELANDGMEMSKVLTSTQAAVLELQSKLK